MKLSIYHFSKIGLFICLGMISTQTFSMNAKLGLWQWTTTINLPGMPSGLPMQDYQSCISAKNLAPKPAGNENCKIISHTIEEDRVDWIMECAEPGNIYIHTGHLKYNDTVAMGGSEASSNGSSMSTMLLGSYIGACNKR